MSPRRTAPPPFAAVVLTGGTAARLGGADKASLELAGRTLLERVLAAAIDATQVVVVGDPVPTGGRVRFVREQPAYGGPAAALLTGRDALDPDRVVEAMAVIACDMPLLTEATLLRLRQVAVDADGAVLVGPDGRRQLALVVDPARLDAVRPDRAHQHGLPLHRLLAGLDLAEVASVGREHCDVDTWADLKALEP